MKFSILNDTYSVIIFLGKRRYINTSAITTQAMLSVWLRLIGKFNLKIQVYWP